MDGIRKGIGRYNAFLQPFFKSVAEIIRIRDHLVESVAAFSGNLLNRFDIAGFIGNALVQQLLPPGTKTAAEQIVSRLGSLANHVADGLGYFAEQIFCFLKVTNQNFPSCRPSGLSAFLQSIPQLSEGLNLSCGFLCGFRHLSNFFGLRLRETLLNQIRFAVSAGELFQCFGENLGGQPFAFGKGLSKRAVHVDGVFRSSAEQFRSPDKRVLEHLTAHTGINNRVPVHKRNLTGCQCLGKLIHCCRSLLRG